MCALGATFDRHDGLPESEAASEYNHSSNEYGSVCVL
jgi:hypothetical protein